MSHSGYTFGGRIATYLGAICYPPYYSRISLSGYSQKGYISPKATIAHSDFHQGNNVFLDDRVLVFQSDDGGAVHFGDKIRILRNCILQTGSNGKIIIGKDTSIQAGCIMSAYLGDISIGERVQIAPNCSFYSYNHSFRKEKPIWNQPLYTKGGIVIGSDCWIGVGCTILDGVVVGPGAVIGAGSVVNCDVPKEHIVSGVPAKIIRKR